VNTIATTFPHAPWCDPERHDDGTTHPIPDANWQICFSPAFELDFGDRGAAGVEYVSGDLSFEHVDVWGETADPCASISFNGTEGVSLAPDQLLPVANLLRALDAVYKGENKAASALLVEAYSGAVDIKVDVEREERREAARRVWQEKAEAEEAAQRAKTAEHAEAIAEARRRLAERSPRVVAEDSVAYYEQQLAAARRVLADAVQAEAEQTTGGAA
jgi:hypothetical protein